MGRGLGGEWGVRIEREMSLGVVRVALAARGGVPALSCPLAPVALALLFAVVTQGDAYLFDRLGGCSGGVRSRSIPCPLVL